MRNLSETPYFWICEVKKQFEDKFYLLVMEESASFHFRWLDLLNSSLGDIQAKPWCWRKSCSQCCRWHPSL